MNWRVKQAVFKALECLPRRLGDSLYHGLQAATGSLRMDAVLQENQRTYREFEQLLTATGRDFAGKHILELGSGWLPATPYLLLCIGGGAQVDTYDIAEHYSAARVRQFNHLFERSVGHLPPLNGSGPYPLPRAVSYFPGRDLAALPPAPHSVDMVISRYVLQNIPADVLLEIHRVLRRTLRPGGVVLHLVSPSDQRAYSDRSLSLFDFLKYSQEEWDRLCTRFYFHNRLRLPQYRQLFQDAGFCVERETYKKLEPGTSQSRKFEELRIHPDFAGFSPEELTASALGFVLA